MSAVFSYFRHSVAARFLLICVLAAAIRMAGIGDQSFWTDEVLTLKISPQPWDQMLASLKNDESCKPPIYYVVMHFLLGKNPDETQARIPSAIFGALSCGVFLLVGENLWGLRRGWLPAALLLVSPFALWYSQEARMYSLWLLLDLTTLYFFLKYRSEHRISWLLLLAGSAATSCYTFTYGFFLLAWLGFAALADADKYETNTLKRLIAALLLCLILFLPGLWQMIHLANSALTQFNRGLVLEAFGFTFFVLAFGLTLGATQEQLRLLGTGFFKLHIVETTWMAFLGIAVLFLVFVGIRAIRKDRNLIGLILGGLMVFCAGPALVSLLRPNVTYNPRYALVALIPFLLLLSAAIPAAIKTRSGLFCLFLFSFGLLASDLNYYFATAYQRDDLRAATSYIVDRKCSLVLVSATFSSPVVDYYGKNQLTVLPYPPKDHLIEELNPAQPLWKQLKEAGRFAWVYTRPDHWDRQGHFPQWLKENFNILETGHWTGVTVFICTPRQPAAPGN